MEVISVHPCRHSRAYMTALYQTHVQSELPLLIRQHLRAATNNFLFRRLQAQHRLLLLFSGLGAGTASDSSSTLHPNVNYVGLALQKSFPRREANLRLNGIQQQSIDPLSSPSTWTTLSELGAAYPTDSCRDPTLQEQELALRVVQSLCMHFPEQRRFAAAGSLLPLAVDIMNHYEEFLRDGGTCAEQAQIRVLLALIDAVEAACHYSPHSLQNFVALGGVKHFMNVARCPAALSEIQSAILHFFSLVLNETECHRRLLPGSSGGAAPLQSEWPDRVSASKLFHAMSDYMHTEVPRHPMLLLDIAALGNFRGLCVPTNLPRSDMYRAMQQAQRAQDAALSTLLSNLERPEPPNAQQ